MPDRLWSYDLFDCDNILLITGGKHVSTHREFWTLTHGMILGALFLLAFAGGLAGLYSLRPELVTASGLKVRLLRLKIGTWLMAVVARLIVITGTYIVYPWYRAPAPEGADLSLYPRSFLKADPALASLHTFGSVIIEGLGKALNWWNPAGPLTGKTGAGVIAWLISWALLNTAWKGRDYDLRKAFIITLIGVILGLILTFPPVFEAFE